MRAPRPVFLSVLQAVAFEQTLPSRVQARTVPNQLRLAQIRCNTVPVLQTPSVCSPNTDKSCATASYTRIRPRPIERRLAGV